MFSRFIRVVVCVRLAFLVRMNDTPLCREHISCILASVDGHWVAPTFRALCRCPKKDNFDYASFFPSLMCLDFLKNLFFIFKERQLHFSQVNSKLGSMSGGLQGGHLLGSSLLKSINTGDWGVAVLLGAHTRAPCFSPHISVRWAKLSQFWRDFYDIKGHVHSKT